MRGPRPLSTGESGQSKHGVQIELRVGLALALLLLAACAVPVGTPDADELNGGILVAFDVVGEEFHVWVTNLETAEQILDHQQGTSSANIPNGRILHGPGRGGDNSPWSWHLDPVDIEMAEVTIEVGDGTPSFVGEEVDYFVEKAQR